MAGKFNSSSYPVKIYLLTLFDRSFGGSTKNLGIFSSLDKIDEHVYKTYLNRYNIEPIENGYLLSDSMTGLTLFIKEFVLDEYDSS